MRHSLLAISILALAACSQKPASVKDYGQFYYKDSRGEAGSLADAERAREMRLHKMVDVRKGDDLYAIAERYNTTTREIIEFNNLKPPYNLTPGQQLKISRPQVYVARYGETLQSISRKEGLDVSELARINDLQAPYTIDQGQQIRLPYRAYNGGFTSPKSVALPTSKIEVGSLAAAHGGKIESSELAPVGTSAIKDDKWRKAHAIYDDTPDFSGSSGQPSPGKSTKYVLTPLGKETPHTKQNFAKVEEPRQLAHETHEESSWNPFGSSAEEKALPKTIEDESPALVPRKAVKAERAEPEAPKRQEIARVEEKPARAAREAAPDIAEGGAAIGFIWPLKGKVIGDFGPQKGGINNEGINIAAPVGTPVKAAADGEVIYTGTGLKSYGKLVIIKHKNGWVTAYAHNSDILVKSGQRVHQGQTISKVGNTGRVEKPQLHFAIRQGREAVDPLDYLG
ncbi:MAG: LysM peptidoglycan-binding domain-containing protein, partial [Proteobacteria bacterium]|nr:LysM peptidoglycan-binding domain-containing protein [Pseudomonadota bacterium]